jgi:hypothetical protein
MQAANSLQTLLAAANVVGPDGTPAGQVGCIMGFGCDAGLSLVFLAILVTSRFLPVALPLFSGSL